APYGKPRFVDLIKGHLIDLKEDGSFRLNMKYFGFASSLSMTNRPFAELFGLSPREPESAMSQDYMDMAASVQKVTEEIMVRLARTLRRQTGAENLCLAGGVALNCVANGVIEREKIFRNIWIQPAAGDAGNALGAALASHYLHHKKIRRVVLPDAMKGAFLGPSYSDESIEGLLKDVSARYDRLEEPELLESVTRDLEEQQVVGWFQGAMEYGARSLGARSI
ncbi:MAG TPA: carbamoyltransferase N-terminal domain-containing protein, partial [Pseudobdellovibrionaceae bacterium]|nr:carbamoyltransferase N-terminal domain-containing protein [Pseudobdellovibrionaceae bacterium]